ncbi:hypothetical protein CAPTEDRAFT_197986 [Capitella teleta]|uniref:Peroxisome assembly protein 26 n=1 Tax=Capitella teleta TaxID=283909 RepID=R7T724_CAPTE|nr:hypothetical protein CAPTEDRAFT_197986 [Capitella teleta]|eukprot:ELT89370.1 hypothetical protein CAPTEDRAFT_197986 [Capitella teleta]
MAPRVDLAVINSCNNLLLDKEFERCYEICGTCISECLNHLEVPRIASIRDSLCLIAIQALAELNRWQEVVPYVTKTYSGMEECPVQIIQACLLLHHHVRDLSTCSVLANIWLRKPSNMALDDYVLVLDTYLFQVLYNVSRWDEMLATVELCSPAIGSSSVEMYKQQISQLRERAEMNRIETLATQAQQDEQTEEMKKASKESAVAKPSLKKYLENRLSLCRFYAVKSLTWMRNSTSSVQFQNGALLVIIFYLLFTRANADFLSWQTIWSLWSSLVKFWKAMFAPLHQSRSD